MDGSVLSLTWNTIYNDNIIIGYSAQVQITDLNSHTITSQSKLSILVYGFGDYTGYSYSAGVNLMQLTGKIESLVIIINKINIYFAASVAGRRMSCLDCEIYTNPRLKF